MSYLVSLLSETEKKLLAQAVALRSLVRRLDAPLLHKLLNEAATSLEEAQRELSETRTEAEEAYDALENIRDNNVPLPPRIIALIRRYRRTHPKRLKP